MSEVYVAYSNDLIFSNKGDEVMPMWLHVLEERVRQFLQKGCSRLIQNTLISLASQTRVGGRQSAASFRTADFYFGRVGDSRSIHMDYV